MHVNKYLLPIFGVVPMLALVVLTLFTGNWSTSGRASVDMTSLTPENIKGWMTWQDISDGLDIPLNDLYTLFAVPADIPPTTALKDMEKLLAGFETSTVRETLSARQTGAPPPVAPLAQPASATTPAPVLSPEPTASQPAVDTAATSAQPMTTPQHTPAGSGTGSGMGDGTGPTPLPPGQILPATEIKGRLTLAEIAEQAAVPLDKLLAGLNLPADFDPDTQVMTLIADGKLAEIQTVRDVVATLQAAGQ